MKCDPTRQWRSSFGACKAWGGSSEFTVQFFRAMRGLAQGVA